MKDIKIQNYENEWKDMGVYDEKQREKENTLKRES